MLKSLINKKHFPLFNTHPKLAFLDNASTTQKPQCVIDKYNEYYYKYNANVHRGIYQIGEKATFEYEAVRKKILKYVYANETYSVIFTSGTTESLNLLAHSLSDFILKADDEILITEMEHHSNIVPWQIVCKKFECRLKYIPITEEGEWDLSEIDLLLTSKTKIVSIIHQSNVFGTINPILKIVNLAKSKGVITLIDGAQSAPHFPVDLSEIDCDFYVFSGHKMVGPTGVGVLIGRKSLLEEMDPFLGGGEMINKVTLNSSTWNDVPWKFEAGTPNIAQVIGLGAAIDFLNDIGLNKVQGHEEKLLQYGLESLSTIDGIILYGSPKNRGAVIPFNVKDIHSHDLAKFLDTDNICIRAGHHCPQPIMDKLGIYASARARLYLYNDTDDIDRLIESIKKTLNIFA